MPPILQREVSRSATSTGTRHLDWFTKDQASSRGVSLGLSVIPCHVIHVIDHMEARDVHGRVAQRTALMAWGLGEEPILRCLVHASSLGGGRRVGFGPGLILPQHRQRSTSEVGIIHNRSVIFSPAI